MEGHEANFHSPLPPCAACKKKKKGKNTHLLTHVWCQYQWKQTSAGKTIDYIVDLENKQIVDQGCFSLK